MKKQLNAGRKAAEAGIEKRNQAILKAHHDKIPLRKIADEVGLSWSGVRKIINNEKGADK